MKRVPLLVALLLSSCTSCEERAADGLERGVQATGERVGDTAERLGDTAQRLEDGAERLGDRAERLLDRRNEGERERAAPPPPARDGNRARLLINGEAAFLERLALIDSARRSIHIQALIFKADTVGCAIADRLIARKRENPELDIRVIVDAYANIQDYDAQMLYFELMDAGIEVQGYEPLYLEWMNEINVEDWTAGNKRYHEKYWVVDGERAIVGGMNIADEYARVGDEATLIWRDQDIFLEGPVVEDIAAAFDANFSHFRYLQERRPALIESDVYWNAWRHVHPDLRRRVTGSLRGGRAWSRSETQPLDLDALRERAVETELRDDVRVRFVRSRPRVGERHIDEVYRAQIDAAQTSIVIANAYFIPSEALRDALSSAARRGVQVTVITNSKATNDIPMINDAGRVAYAPLIEAGVRVYEWHAERHGEGTIHAKFAVFDSEVAIIGSYNLDPRSLALNSEDVVVVQDARLASTLHERAIGPDLALARRVTPRQAETWSDPRLIPAMDRVPPVPWWDPRFDADRFELFLIGQASRVL